MSFTGNNSRGMMQSLVGEVGGGVVPARRDSMSAREIADVVDWKIRMRAGWQAAANYAGRSMQDVRGACTEVEVRMLAARRFAARAVTAAVATVPAREVPAVRPVAVRVEVTPKAAAPADPLPQGYAADLVMMLARGPLVRREIVAWTGWGGSLVLETVRRLEAAGWAASIPSPGKVTRYDLTDDGWRMSRRLKASGARAPYKIRRRSKLGLKAVRQRLDTRVLRFLRRGQTTTRVIEDQLNIGAVDAFDTLCRLKRKGLVQVVRRGGATAGGTTWTISTRGKA